MRNRRWRCLFTGDTGTDDDDRGARSGIHERNGTELNGMNVCFCVREREREREREEMVWGWGQSGERQK